CCCWARARTRSSRSGWARRNRAPRGTTRRSGRRNGGATACTRANRQVGEDGVRNRIAWLSLAAAFALPLPAHAIFDDNVARAKIEELRRQVEAAAKLVDERFGKTADRSALVELAAQIE